MEAQVTMNRLTRARPRRARGQVLVLACVTFLTMALMMLASFGVANAIHERIRIQAAADLVDLCNPANIELRDTHASARRVLDKTVFFQQTQGLQHRLAGHRQALGQVFLRQTLARRQGSFADGVKQTAVHLFNQVRGRSEL